MINPTDLYEKAIRQAEDYADRDYAAGILEDALSTLEGHLTAELKAKGEPTTILSKLVKKDERWITAANDWRAAKKSALIAKMKYEQVNRYQDNIRTVEASTRKLA